MIYKKIEAEELFLSSAEASQRLGVPRDFKREAYGSLERELVSVLDCKMAAVRVPVLCRGDEVDLGFLKVNSKNLSCALGDSGEAFVFAVTLGMGVERMLARLSKISVSGHYIADALSSAVIPSAPSVSYGYNQIC